jgi:hypothetical protein
MYSQGWIFSGTLYRSTDGGVTYTGSTPFTGNMQSMHANGSTVFVSTYQSNNNYFYISTDSGATWTASGISGLPGSTPQSNPQSFSVYSNGKHNLWLNSGASFTWQYYTSTNALSWTFIGNVTGLGTISPYYPIWYYNGAYYSSVLQGTGVAGSKASNGNTFTTFGVGPTISGFGTRTITATSSGLVLGYSGYCCSGTKSNSSIWTTNSFSPAASGCWSKAYSYSYASFGRMSPIHGYNQDQG